MKLEEFADIAQVTIEIEYSKNQYAPWIARIVKRHYDVFFKENKFDGMARYLHGGATTPNEAVRALASSINGSKYGVLVVDAMTDSSGKDRQTFGIPENLE